MSSYHGYLALPRQAKLLRHELGNDLFGFYLGLAMEAVWDRRNKNFGRVCKSQAQLARDLHMTQPNVSRYLKKLEKHKYFVIRNKSQKFFLLGYFYLFLNDVVKKLHKKNYLNINELYADMYRLNTELQQENAEMQDKRVQKGTQRLYSSSKNNVSLLGVSSEESEIDINEVDEGIERMIKERIKD